MGLGPQKRSLAAGACAVDPVFSWLSPSPPMDGLFNFVFFVLPVVIRTVAVRPRLVQLSPARSIWAPRPALPRARRGGGAPSAQVTGHLQPPIIGNTQTSKFRFYHPYTLAPQNDRLDEKTRKITFVCSVYARFEELAGF